MSEKKTEHALEYFREYLERVKLQQEARDRWFSYYLIIMGAPLGAILTLLQIDSIRGAMQNDYQSFSFISFLLFLIGFFFFMMFLRARRNYLELYKKMDVIEQNIFTTIIPNNQYKSFSVQKYGGDFYIACLYILLNSIWFSATSIFLWLSFWRTTLSMSIV